MNEIAYDPAWTGQARTFLHALLKDTQYGHLFSVMDVRRIEHGTLLVTLSDKTTMRIDVERYPTSLHERKQARLEQGLKLTTNAPGIGNVLRKGGFTRHGYTSFGGSGFEVTGKKGEGVSLDWIDERDQPKLRTEMLAKMRTHLEGRGYIITVVAKTGSFIVS